MIDYKKVFVDTAPFIYFLDDDVNFGQTTKTIFEQLLSEGKPMISSTITCEEYLVYPYKTNNIEKIDVFFEFVSENDIELIPITLDIAKKASKIRADYEHFKTMDCLQLAVACLRGCDLFLTNDIQLKQFKEIDCVTVGEWDS